MIEGCGSESHYFALPAGAKLYEFEVEAVLGHGGFGITYRATDTLLQETVAIKEFLPNEVAVRISDATVRAKSQRDQSDFETGLKSFLEEARMMARFRHPRIVHVRRFFEMHGTGYIVLDYEHGQTLSERLDGEPLPEAQLRGILSGVLDGLEVIHNRAILHRDLKPSNIMLREDGAPVIIDFGAARDFQARHSRSVTAIATAGYAPPEQYGVGSQQGPWSDLYALGAIAYRAVSGVTPIDSLRRLRSDPLVPAVTAGAGKYDEALLRTIDWLLKIDEVDRPASVAQVREALRGGAIPVAPQTQAGRPIPDNGRVAAQPGGADLTPVVKGETLTLSRPPPRRDRIAAVAGLLVLTGLAVSSYAFYTKYPARQQADLQAKQQAELQVQQANERKRQQLTEQLANAGADLAKLEQFLAACGSDCPDNLRTQAQVRIESAKQQQHQAELARKDEANYREARGNLGKLRAYVSNCTSCSFREAARSEVASLEQQQQQVEAARNDEATYRAAQGDLTKLRAYNDHCTICAFKPAARSEIEAIEQQASARMPSGCDRLAAAPADPQVPQGVVSVDFSAIHPEQAIPACRNAVQAYPNEPRFLGQLGRALHAAKAYDEAARFYKMGSDLGNGPATNNLGKLYSDGTGVTKNNEEAARLFRKAVELGVPAALTNMAKMYQEGTGVPKDDTKAFQMYQRAADLGMPDAVSNLGVMYLRGQGASKDYSQALSLFRRASGLGNGAAEFYLGLMYQNGFGVDKDAREAVRHYRLAVDSEIPDAMSNLGAIYLLGQGVSKDYSQALLLLHRASELGSSAATHYLGFAYQNGFGVAKDAEEAARYYRKAADQGVAESMANLGVMYLLGQGIPRDYSAALPLFRRAADLGNANAMANLGFMYANGKGISKDVGEGVRLYRKASDLGDVVGMTNLAVIYIDGIGIGKNREEGVRLLRKASSLGYEVAQKYLKILGMN